MAGKSIPGNSGAGNSGPGNSGAGNSRSGSAEPGDVGPAPGKLGAAQLVPGLWIRHPGEPEWGPGQVQSVIGHRITVNFENAGKQLINGAVVQLVEIGEDEIG